MVFWTFGMGSTTDQEIDLAFLMIQMMIFIRTRDTLMEEELG